MSERERQQSRVCLEEDTETDADTGFREFAVLKSDLFYRPNRFQQQAQSNAKNKEAAPKQNYIEKITKSGYRIAFAVIGLYVVLWFLRPLNFDEALYAIQWTQWRMDFVEKHIVANVVFFILAGVVLPVIDSAPDLYRVPKSIFACTVIVACLVLAPILYFLLVEMEKDASFFNTETVAFILFLLRGIALLSSFVVSVLICFVRIRLARR